MQATKGRAATAVIYRVFFAYKSHWETLFLKGLIYLVAHLETLQVDAWAYLCDKVCGVGAVNLRHPGYELLHDTHHRTSPSGMNGTDGTLSGVIEQHGDTVGCRDTDTHLFHIGHQRIIAFKVYIPLFVNHGYLSLMHLMRHQQTVVGNIQKAAQRLAVLADSLITITTISVDIKLAIAPRAIAPFTHRAEGGEALSYMIVLQTWYLHILAPFCLQRYAFSV